MEKGSIRVFCVEDHEETAAFYRISLGFEPDMEFVGNHSSTAGLLQALEAAQPTVLLLDLRIPGCDTLQALAEVRARFPDLVILVVSGLDQEEVVAEAFSHGASGFFMKTMDLTDLPAIIRRAAAGERINIRSRPRFV